MIWLRQNLIRNKKGFTIIEIAGAICILAVAIPAIIMMFTSTFAVDSEVNESTRAYFLANMLMNELSQRRFLEDAAHPGNSADSGEVIEDSYSRTNFDDIDDYDQFTTWGHVSPPHDESGAVIDGYSNFSQYVTVVNVAPPPSDGSARSFASVSDGTTSFKLVTVEVQWEGGKQSFKLNKVFAQP